MRLRPVRAATTPSNPSFANIRLSSPSGHYKGEASHGSKSFDRKEGECAGNRFRLPAQAGRRDGKPADAPPRRVEHGFGEGISGSASRRRFRPLIVNANAAMARRLASGGAGRL